MSRTVVNIRVLTAPVTGVQRYTRELLTRWEWDADTISPEKVLHGGMGHAWEQLVLPGKLKGRLLFSPANTGPLSVGKQVVTIHDMSAFDCPDGFSRRFAAWYRFLLPRLAKRVKYIVTVSEFVKERIIHHTGIHPDKVAVIPNGVSPRFCPEAVAGLEGTLASLRLPSRRYILVVGSLEPRKNLARLFHVWAQVWRRLPGDLWLVVVGSAGSAQVFAKLRFDSLPPHVFFAGHVSDEELPPLYAGAVGLTYISRYEGFGLPLLEAMASGTPVLTANSTSLAEVAGDAGILVDPVNEEDIAKGILAMVEDPALRQTLRGRGLVRAKQFSWDETARRTWQVLQKASAER